MINKIFVFWWIALSAILVIENMVTGWNAIVFIDNGSKAWFLSVVSVIVWMFIWYWIKWMLEKEWW
jgi:hypothetical protein